MTTFKAYIWQLRKSSFEIGQDYGVFLKKQPDLLTMYKHVTKETIDWRNMEAIYRELAPHLLEELQGVAEKLEVSYTSAAACFSGYDVPKTKAMGCTTLIDNGVYTRNYDFSPLLYDGIFSMIQTNSQYASAGYNLQLLGRHDGVNEKGLVIGLHFVSNEGYRKGISPWVSCRIVLDNCSTVEEAVCLLKLIPHAACYNFSIGDEKGNMATVETCPEKVEVLWGNGSLACTNHFKHKKMTTKNRTNIAGSLQRQTHLAKLMGSSWNQTKLFEHFSEDTSPLFFTDYQDFFGTIHTFSYAFNQGLIKTALAKSAHPLVLDFKKWVGGDDIVESVLTGEINEG
ncbi:C45 family autoproteolytic acyltransferase/hydolase [Bacillus sp. Au-Bac7]|uniref:C45 family autoproteolytic acyltransferase/hydolase n=1 Tax=Bacillus sp. Au-Bac7 TaxID=2906458 RepID=UPI001E283ED9|nr:C45 family peptidase [Bacillus sp. Au-Bac7]MCE4050908.1 C45 family peptidase [Bacillus sp. Au-Bac7]